MSIPFFVLPQGGTLVSPGQELLREVLSTDTTADLRRTVLALSGDRTRSGSERETPRAKMNVSPARVRTVNEGGNNPVSLVGEGLHTRQAVQLTLAVMDRSQKRFLV